MARFPNRPLGETNQLSQLLPIGQTSSTPMPDGIRPFQSASPEEQFRRAHVVLVGARRLYGEKFGELWECIQTAGDGRIECEYARRLLRAMLGEYDLPGWERNHTRRRADVYRLLDAAIRKSRQLKGGWFVALPGGAP